MTVADAEEAKTFTLLELLRRKYYESFYCWARNVYIKTFVVLNNIKAFLLDTYCNVLLFLIISL